LRKKTIYSRLSFAGFSGPHYSICGLLWVTASMAIHGCGLAAVPTTELRRAHRSERLIRRDD
jgi:hypothetical protein